MYYNFSDEQKIFLHLSYSMLEEGYDVDQIMEFWNLDDQSKILEICESITLSETIDMSNSDFLLICERGPGGRGLGTFLNTLFGKGGKVRLKTPPLKTSGGRTITQSGQTVPKVNPNKPPTSTVTGQPKPTLIQRAKDLNNKIPPKVRKGAIVAGATGLGVLGAKYAIDNGLVPKIPDDSGSDDSGSKDEQGTGSDPLATDSTDNNNGNNGNNDDKTSSTDSKNTPAERKRRNYAWASINNKPKNFYRNDPAYYDTKFKYNNIRGNPIPTEFTKDHYEVIADYLIAEGHASDIKEADYVMKQLDEEFIQIIIESSCGSHKKKKKKK